MKPLLVYLLLINAAGFTVMLADKYKARKNKWRIPEKVLFGISLLGGSLGSLLGMYAVRHKTKHPSFTIGIPLIFAMQVTVFFLFFPIP